MFFWCFSASRPIFKDRPSASTQTSLPLRSLFPCHFCSSSPSNSQRPLKRCSPSVASSHAISAAPAPVTLSDRSNLAPPPWPLPMPFRKRLRRAELVGHGKRLRRGSEVWVDAEPRWGWSCRNGLGGAYAKGAEAAEMAWEEAMEGEPGLSVRWESLGWRCGNSMGGGYGGGARSEGTVRDGGAGDAEIAWEDATEGERGRRVYAEGRWGWRCRNSMGGRYGGGAR